MPSGVYKKTKEHILKVGKVNKGRKNTEQAKRNISIGTKKAMEIKKSGEKISKAMKGRISSKKGTKLCQTIKDKISKTTKETMNKPEVLDKVSGKNHYRWIEDRNLIMKDGRNNSEYQQWVKQVKKRDANVCRLKDENCSGYNIVHHIKNWKEYLMLRYKIENGITLCQAHHPRGRAKEKRLIPLFEKLVSVSNE